VRLCCAPQRHAPRQGCFFVTPALRLPAPRGSRSQRRQGSRYPGLSLPRRRPQIRRHCCWGRYRRQQNNAAHFMICPPTRYKKNVNKSQKITVVIAWESKLINRGKGVTALCPSLAAEPPSHWQQMFLHINYIYSTDTKAYRLKKK
jgi:hypothetical protein